jgi:hypothetical protein
MNKTNVIKSNQEQAVASWINYLNQLRLDELTIFLNSQQLNLENATNILDEALGNMRDILNSNRGGERGIHGYLAEVAEYGIGNARELFEGRTKNYEWLNDNGVSDLRRNGIDIQQKFYESDGLFSLGAVAKHLKKYPDYLKNGAKYQIPKDQYEIVKKLHSMSEKEAYKTLSNSGDGPTIHQWRKVNDFFKNEEISFEDVEPAHITYAQAQKNVAVDTLKNEKSSLVNREKELERTAYNKSKPSFGEGAKVTAVSATIEGSTALFIAITNKVKAGKHIKDFDNNDWNDVFKDVGISTAEGGIRGASIYALTNYSATPSAVANALVTASFGVAEQMHLYKKGEINELSLIENSELLCLNVTISALSSLIGQAVIPIPVIGAVIGNTIGSRIYQIAKDCCSINENAIMQEYIDSINTLNNDLDSKYQQYVITITKDVELYMSLLEQAFSPDVMEAFNGSIKLAEKIGVPHEEILDTYEKGFVYFTE